MYVCTGFRAGFYIQGSIPAFYIGLYEKVCTGFPVGRCNLGVLQAFLGLCRFYAGFCQALCRVSV